VPLSVLGTPARTRPTTGGRVVNRAAQLPDRLPSRLVACIGMLRRVRRGGSPFSRSDPPEDWQTGRESSSPACQTVCLAGSRFALARCGTSPVGWLPSLVWFGKSCKRMPVNVKRMNVWPVSPVSPSPVPRGPYANRFPWPVCRFSLLRCLTVPVMPYSLFFFPCLQVFFLSSCKSSIQGIPLASFGFFMHYGMPPLGNRGAAELVPWLAEDLGPWAGAMTSLRRASDPE